jgi:hypothetical protein
MSLVAHQFGRVEYLFLFFQLPLYRENFARHIQLFYQKSREGKSKASATAVTNRLTCYFLTYFQYKFYIDLPIQTYLTYCMLARPKRPTRE